MDSLVELVKAIGGIVATIGLMVTGFFAFKKYMRNAQDNAAATIASSEAERSKRLDEREAAINHRIDETLAKLQGRYDELLRKYDELVQANSKLQATHIQTLTRLDNLGRDQERSVSRIRELESQVLALGGTLQ